MTNRSGVTGETACTWVPLRRYGGRGGRGARTHRTVPRPIRSDRSRHPVLPSYSIAVGPVTRRENEEARTTLVLCFKKNVANVL